MKLKRWQIILVSLLLFILVLLILLPGIARRMAVKNGDKWLGRKIEVGSLGINYFTSTVRLFDFKMYEANRQDVFVSFDTLIVDAELYKLFAKDVDIEHILLSGLKSNIIQKDSVFNFTDLISFFSPPDTADKKQEESDNKRTSTALSFQISNIHIANSDIHFIDAIEEEEISIVDIDLVVPYIGWKKEVDRASGLKFNFENGGYLALDLDWNPGSRDLNGKVTIEQLDLNNISGYMHKFINHGTISGMLGASIDVHRPVKDLHSLQFSGDIGITRLSMTTKKGDTIANMDRLQVKMEDVRPMMNTYLIDTIMISNPWVIYEQYDSTHSNFSELAKQSSGSHDKVPGDTLNHPGQRKASEILYKINTFRLLGGSFDFIDHSLESGFNYNMGEIEATADNLSSENDGTELYTEMKLKDHGKLVSELSFDPKKPLELDLTCIITDFQLSDLNTYSTYYAGLPILYGNTYYKSEVTIHGGILESKNEIIIEGIELGDQSKGVTDLPLGLALMLLKDKHGDVSMDIPVHGDLNEPGIGLGKIIMGSFKDFIIKIAAAPVKILGRTAGVKPNEIKSLKYEYLDAELTKKKIRQLEALLELESKKPEIGIELVYFNDVSLEREAIAMNMIGQKFNNRQRDYLKDTEEFAEYVHEKVKNDTLAVEKACLQLVDGSKVEKLLEELKNSRINSVRDFLDAHNDSTYISLFVPETDALRNAGSEPIFEVKYSLKAKKKAAEEELTQKMDSTGHKTD